MPYDATTTVDTSFDRYARMVRRALSSDVALVTVLEHGCDLFVGAAGLSRDLDATHLSRSLGRHVVEDRSPVVAYDARQDPRLRLEAAESDLEVIGYAGWPVTDHTGSVVGSLCAIDHRPRVWNGTDLEALADLAAACSSELAQRRLVEEAALSAERAHDLSQRSRVLLTLSEGLSSTRTLSDVAAAVESIALEQLGCLRAGMWLRDVDRPTRTADLPAVNAAESAESLTFVRTSDSDWHSAQRFAVLGLDRSNPIGEALVGGRTVEFADLASQNLAYPHLANPDQIGEARAFVPLTARGHVHGTLALLWPDTRALSDEDRATLHALASYTAQAVQRAHLLEDRLGALVTLQSSLLPRLPEPEHLELAARYRPAAVRDQVGGDWYDAVVMPSGATALMIGDVVGHDITAAATMGQFRTMLRALAWSLDETPSRSVARLDQALDELGVDGMASLVYALVEQTPDQVGTGERTVCWTNAGHPPPLVVEADGTLRWLAEAAPDVMLGVRLGADGAPVAERREDRVVVGEGATLLLYTDGLVERRGEDIADGLDRLADAVVHHHGRDLAPFLDGVLADLVGRRADDDVALLAVRVGGPHS